MSLSKAFAYLLIIAVLQACTALEQPNATLETPEVSLDLRPDANLIRNHMAYLANDELRGREAGTPGYDEAAAYVAKEFEKLGLLTGGDDNSYFQEVPLRRSLRDSNAVQLTATATDGSKLSLQESVDYVVGGSLSSASSSVTAQVVFAGYGLVAPDLGRDDYAGLDVEGN